MCSVDVRRSLFVCGQLLGLLGLAVNDLQKRESEIRTNEDQTDDLSTNLGIASCSRGELIGARVPPAREGEIASDDALGDRFSSSSKPEERAKRMTR